MDRQKRTRIRKFSKYADRIYALNPDLLHVLPGNARFMPYASVDLTEWKAGMIEQDPEVPVVGHAPTHRGVKGTRFIVDAVSRLRSEGVPFEFVLVEGLSNEEARKSFQREYVRRLSRRAGTDVKVLSERSGLPADVITDALS